MLGDDVDNFVNAGELEIWGFGVIKRWFWSYRNENSLSLKNLRVTSTHNKLLLTFGDILASPGRRQKFVNAGETQNWAFFEWRGVFLKCGDTKL